MSTYVQTLVAKFLPTSELLQFIVQFSAFHNRSTEWKLNQFHSFSWTIFILLYYLFYLPVSLPTSMQPTLIYILEHPSNLPSKTNTIRNIKATRSGARKEKHKIILWWSCFWYCDHSAATVYKTTSDYFLWRSRSRIQFTQLQIHNFGCGCLSCRKCRLLWPTVQ